MREDEQNPTSSSRLRRILDAGKGRDKVAYPDPAAAPLGTDDEAAGTPITEMQAQMALKHETRDRSEGKKDGIGNVHAFPIGRARQGESGSKPLMLRLALIIIGLALLVLILLSVSTGA